MKGQKSTSLVNTDFISRSPHVPYLLFGKRKRSTKHHHLILSTVFVDNVFQPHHIIVLISQQLVTKQTYFLYRYNSLLTLSFSPLSYFCHFFSPHSLIFKHFPLSKQFKFTTILRAMFLKATASSLTHQRICFLARQRFQ